MVDDKQIIEKARQGFEVGLFTQNYSRIHADEQHLKMLLSLCPIIKGKHYLDLGTGNGYIAFSLAQQRRDISVTGLDIVEKAIEANNRKAEQERYGHLKFKAYQGQRLPFGEDEFGGVISRYVFHHFPTPTLMAEELARTIEKDGFCIISDPMPNEGDRVDFINEFAGMKSDGHVRFYGKEEMGRIMFRAGFEVEEQVMSEITFPREKTAGYERLVERTPREILETYDVRVEENLVYVTVAVLNTRFRR